MRNFPLWTLRNDVNSILATLASHMFKKIQKAPNLHLQLAVAFKYFFARNCGKVSALHTLETRLVELKTNFFFLHLSSLCSRLSVFTAIYHLAFEMAKGIPEFTSHEKKQLQRPGTAKTLSLRARAGQDFTGGARLPGHTAGCTRFSPSRL